MTKKEIIEKEKEVNRDLKRVFFYKEGDWYHAYEWSGYLAYLYTSKNSVTLKPTRKELNNYGDYIFVGLKLTSFEKYFKGVDISNNMHMEDEVINLDLSEFFMDEDFSGYETMLEEWKKETNLSGKKKKKNKQYAEEFSTENMQSIVKMIASYPLMEKTPIENISFLTMLQNNCIKLI